MTARTAMLVLVDSAANSNKFYRLSLDATTGVVTKTYGRVGADGVTATEHTGAAGYHKLLQAKLRKGYREVDVADAATAAPRIAQGQLAALAKTGLTSGKSRTNANVHALIERIVQVNAHQIFEQSNGLITVDTSGRMKTPLGLVTGASIAQASVLLDQMEAADPNGRRHLLEEYLTYVPQKVGHRAGWADSFFDGAGSFGRQRDFLDQLRDSVVFFETQATAAASTPEAAVDASFKYKIRAVSPTGDVFRRAQNLYEAGRNDKHVSARLRLKNVYELIDPAGGKTYREIAAEIGNVQQLWHGTRAANLLSILRRGLFVPPRSGTSIHTVGRMFGDGIYLSNQSTKSLNYSAGYWGGGSRDSNCFMLLNDVAMGSEYRPTRHGFDSRIPVEARTLLNKFGKPFNSINVKAGTGGVLNHEAVVWNTDQIRLRYLCEFDSK